MISLTARETAVLAYLAGHIEARGFGPSYEDIARVVGLSSKSRVRRYRVSGKRDPVYAEQVIEMAEAMGMEPVTAGGFDG